MNCIDPCVSESLSYFFAKIDRVTVNNSFPIFSKLKPRFNNTVMNDFKQSKIKVLCNVDLISEGVDVPDCSCCNQDIGIPLKDISDKPC